MILTAKSTLCPRVLRVLLTVFVCAQAPSQSVLYTFNGDSPGDVFGASVSGAGDVNGDGFADLIVGAPNDDNNGTSSGSARVLSGVDGSVLYTFDGDSAGDEFGISVSGAGDVNGDGYDDLIVGAPFDDNNGTGSGSARVFSGVDGSILYTFNGDSAGDWFGYSVSGAGDVDGDGFADVIVGALSDDNNGSNSGSARVFSGLDGSVLYTFYGDSAGDCFGLSVSGAGDVNGNGYADLIVGAYLDDNNGSQSGSARIFSGADGSILYTFDGDSAGDVFGISVSGVEDVNGDGYHDVIVGALFDDNPYTGTTSGSARVFSGVDGSVLYTFYGDSASDRFGFSVSGAGDVNGDGFADLIVGAYQEKSPWPLPGYARAFSGLDGIVLYTLDGDSPGDHLGISVSGAEDVNGDGFDDLIVGAYGADAGAGSARVFASRRELGASYCGPAVPNSTGQPGVLRALGLADVNANELFLTADQLPNGEFGYFLVSRTQGIFLPPGSQGFICIAGDIGRFNQAGNIIQGPTHTIQIDLNSLPTNAPGSQQAMPGETLNFQCWFRDVNNNNFTDAVSVTFQ